MTKSPGIARAMRIVFSYELRKTLRSPAIASFGLAQPLIYLLLFGPVLTGVSDLTGGTSTNAYRVFVPALCVQLALFGGAFVGISLVSEYRSGALERVFATPLPRAALLGGRVVRDALLFVAQAALITAIATALGFRSHPVPLLVCFALVAIVTIALASLSYLTALTTKSEQALSNAFNAVLLPLVLLAGIMLPMSLAPGWLRAISGWNPLTYVVDAARAAIAENYDDGTLLIGFGVAAMLAAGTFVLAARAFAKRS